MRRRTRVSRRSRDACADSGSPEAVALMIELAVDGFYRMEYEADARLGRARARALPAPLDDRR